MFETFEMLMQMLSWNSVNITDAALYFIFVFSLTHAPYKKKELADSWKYLFVCKVIPSETKLRIHVAHCFYFTFCY